MNFWQQLPKPIMVVAPMADVTDAPFRRMIAKYSAHTRADGSLGGPDVMWTEFVAADGLMRATPEGKKKLMADLIYCEEERPIVAQLFSSNEEYMEKAARLAVELGFDGIDLNMGCPSGTIEKQGCGAAMIKDPAKARAVIRAAKRGAGNLPVSVKTRLGYNADELETWIPEILAEEPAVLTLHARTRKELSKVPAHWDRIARAVAIRDELGSKTLIFGNGDVLSLNDAKQKAKDSGADGVMIGRALFGNPWFFHPTKQIPLTLTALPTHGVNREDIVVEDTSDETLEYIPLEERLRVMIEHTKLFEEILSFKNFSVMKKHYKAYVNGFHGAGQLRAKLMESNSSEEIEVIVHDFLQNHAA
ncbi:MAG: nifR3 family TIM-barrel protein [Patiriisocius sp.]|jgi:nifR3 family TIM-barrel protein